LPNDAEDVETKLFQMGDDDDFDGLQPKRDVGEGEIPEILTRHNVLIKRVRRTRRQVGGAIFRVTSRRGHGGRGG